MDMYREDVLDHYEHPRNQGEIMGEGVETARDSNASCGDMVQFYVKYAKGKIVEVKWKGIGCAITTAAASKLSEYLMGKTLKDVGRMSEEELAQKGIGFEVNPGRMKCLMLPVKVAKKLLES
ncbi:MAG: iron-sulfur cluster assembly scaffold protein [bacterium]